MSISIVVLTWNRAKWLAVLLDALKVLGAPVIVVDNHSTDETPVMLAERYPWCVHVRMPENVGVGARNEGILAAGTDIVISLDDDVLGLDRAALDRLRTRFIDPTIGAVNFRIVDPETRKVRNWIHHCRASEHADSAFDTYEISEGAVAFRRVAVQRVGGYPAHFFISHEGPDLALRLMDAGWRVTYDGGVEVEHWHAEDGRNPWRRYYYDTRNQYLLAMRNLPLGYGCRYLLRGQISTCVYALRDGFLRYWWRGVRHGISGAYRLRHTQRRPVGRDTMAAIAEIDSRRPPLQEMVANRLFRKGMDL